MSERRFTSVLFLAFGPLFVLGGYLVAFTVEGALLIFLGLAMLVTGVLLRTRLPVAASVAAGLVLFAALTIQMAAAMR